MHAHVASYSICCFDEGSPLPDAMRHTAKKSCIFVLISGTSNIQSWSF